MQWQAVSNLSLFIQLGTMGHGSRKLILIHALQDCGPFCRLRVTSIGSILFPILPLIILAIQDLFSEQIDFFLYFYFVPCINEC